MSNRFSELTGMQPQIEIESPEAGYQKGMKAVRGIVAEQGQVMSLTLENNAALYHTNKQLKAERRQFTDRIRDLEHQNRKLTEEVAALSTPINRSLHELEELCTKLSAMNESLRAELTANQFPEYDTDARQAALKAMQAQSAELKADPDVPTQEQINARLDRGLTEHEMSDMDKLLQEQAIAAAEDGIPDTMPGLR